MTQKQPLRERAENTFRNDEPQDLKGLSADEAQRLVHELQVHQVELEMQNEELQLALAELDASHARYVDLYDLAPVGYCTLSGKGLILDANLTAAALLGMTRNALIKKPFTRFIFKEDQDQYYRHRRQLFQAGETQACELRMLKIDGTSFWARLETTSVQGFSARSGKAPNGEPSYRTIFSDISERKLAETALKKLLDELEVRISARTADLEAAIKVLKDDEERFRTVADFTYNWEVWVGPDGQHLYVSPSCKRISGYLPSDFYKDPSLMEKIIHPQDLPGWKRAVTETLARNGEAHFEFRIIVCNGEERWVSLNSQAVYTPNGCWLGRRDSYRDTTDRKQAETERNQSQSRFRALVETSHDWFWETDPTGRYTYVSPKSLELLGYRPEEIIGKSTLEFIHPDKLKEATLGLKKTIEGKKPFRGIEKIYRHKKGYAVIAEMSGGPFFDSRGNLAGFRGIDRDITKKKIREAQTLRTRHLAAIGELAAGVAHEINNPINGIINYAQILVDDASASGGNLEIPQRIIKEGDRIANIVKNLLNFSRQSSGEKHPLSASMVLADSLALFSAQLQKDRIHVTIDISDDIPDILANRQQLQQVFMNILSNSRHALLEKPDSLNRKKQIDITARAAKSNGVKMVVISFHDTGTGITQPVLERIFDPFFTTKAAGKGTGLGLSISYGIVKDHGGNLIIESKPGEYTRAIVYLPADTAH